MVNIETLWVPSGCAVEVWQVYSNESNPTVPKPPINGAITMQIGNIHAKINIIVILGAVTIDW